MNESAPIRVAAVCGSLNPEGKTRLALSLALAGAAAQGAQIKLIELCRYELVFFGQVEAGDYPTDVLRLREELAGAQGIIVGTPEYYGSLSGSLKNALDLVGADALRGKITGLVGVAGGDTGAVNSLNTMRIICRNLHCWALPQEVSVANSHAAFSADGSAADPALGERLAALGAQVAKFASLQQQVRQSEFMRQWEDLQAW